MKEKTLSSTSDTDLLQAFNKLQTTNEIAEVLKELFDVSKIQLITDLSPDEIKLATRIYVIAELKNMKTWKKGLEFYLKLMLSKNRKSRKELLDAIRGYAGSTSFMDKINPFSSNKWGRH